MQKIPPISSRRIIKLLERLGFKIVRQKVFENYLGKIKGKYIPEQIFKEKFRKSVAPLAWSHAMFVIAAKELGYL